MKKRTGKIISVYFLVILGFLWLTGICSHGITVWSENQSLVRNCCIVIDPGHGGEDGGAVSCTGRTESSINLEIALRLNDLIQLLGYDTKMIRKTDTAVYTHGTTIAQKKVSDLKERVRIVESTPHAILISIHQNTFSDGRYSGAQVFYANSSGSQALAQALQENLVTALNPGSTRKCKPATGIYLMEQITHPGVLIECGFLSNYAEEAKLRSSDYQKKLCCVITATVIQNIANT